MDLRESARGHDRCLFAGLQNLGRPGVRWERCFVTVRNTCCPGVTALTTASFQSSVSFALQARARIAAHAEEL